MSFLNNNPSGRNTRGAQPTPNEERASRGDSPFSGDLLQSVRDEGIATTPPPAPTSTAYERPPSFAAPANSGPTPPEKCINVIASGAKWQGNLVVEDSVRIDGVFTGEIEAKGTVHVADGAQVDAKVRAAYVVVSGEFRGEIRCDQRLELLPRSRVSGEVITKVLSVQEGATLDGRVQMSGESTGRRPGRESETPAPASERRERVASGSNGRSNETNSNGA